MCQRATLGNRFSPGLAHLRSLTMLNDPHSRAVLNVVSPQHSGTLTASPPSDVSLYLLCMSIPVCRIVSIA